MTLSLCGVLIENNTVKAYGGAIFFVSNDKTGSVNITDSIIRNNPGGSWYPTYPGISNHAETPITVQNSTISP
jgi:predicted outer membrane repeat protein